jgi:uncharacterized protein YecT (DUF1311 family)
MKKILFVSLVAASTGLLGYEYPNSQQPANRMPRPTRQQANQASRQEQDRTVQGPRSPRPISPTLVRITQAEDRRLNETYQRSMRAAAQEMQAARPALVVIPRNNFATDPSDSN